MAMSTPFPYLNSDQSSFAFNSARQRWPTIITNAAQDLRNAAKTRPESDQQEGLYIADQLEAIKTQVVNGSELPLLVDDGQPDVSHYNDQVKELGGATWLDAPWLFSECLLYRHIHTLFSRSKSWKYFDMFAAIKRKTFRDSKAGVLELARRYRSLIAQLKSSETVSDDQQYNLFTETCLVALWGNATDLSLLTTLTIEQLQDRQGQKARESAQNNILANDLDQVYASLKTNTDARVDIVLDNAGFELFSDLVLAGYLLESGLASTVVLHPKSIPWFVSDVLPSDFLDMLNTLQDPSSLFGQLEDEQKADLESIFDHWSELHQDGKLILRPSRFWTEGSSFWDLADRSPALLQDLQESQLVVFKGDLNYRKLVADVAWPPTTSFKTGLNKLANAKLNILALRTCKADVVVGLNDGQDEQLKISEGDSSTEQARRWAWSGKYAVVQYHAGK